VNLLVRLQMIEHLKYCLHQLILRCYKLLQLCIVVGIVGLVVGLVVVGLTIALAIPHVHHLRDFFRREV
jgi:tetrahydromethanopterin S-methyltransferase subunit F